MADESENAEGQDDAEAPPKKGGVLPFIIVGILGTGMGLAVPFLLPATAVSSTENDDRQKGPPGLEDDAEMVFIPFTEKPVVVNLNGERMTRYLNLLISLQVAKEREADITQFVLTKNILLRDWLIRHLSGKTLDDIRGPAGQNRLRREIRDQFNTMLFPDGYDRIYDILFVEFAVQ